MKTIILPGFSQHNKDWAQAISQKLNVGHKVLIHEWRHWFEDKSFSLKYETGKITAEVGKEKKINIIAKSVGVAVALNLIPQIASKVNKIILCGIASVANEDRKDLLVTVLTKIPIQNILCIQNENDKYVPFKDAEQFYHSVEPKIKVISKPRSDHEYPYSEDFQEFLVR